jgi:hypothetical protein
MYHPEEGRLDDEDDLTGRFLDDMVGAVRMSLSSVYQDQSLHLCVHVRLHSFPGLRLTPVDRASAGTTPSSALDRRLSGSLSSASERTAS